MRLNGWRNRAVVSAGFVCLLMLGCARSTAPPPLWVWLDGGLFTSSSAREALEAAIDSAAAAGATGVVVEVKSCTGETFVPAASFPAAPEVPSDGADLLQLAAARARQHGLKLAAGVQTFFGGNVGQRRGIAFAGLSDWCVTRLTEAGLLRDTENASLRWVRLSPAVEAARKAELQFLDEILGRDEVEGAWLVGVEFPDVWSDFGLNARRAFEGWLGMELRSWPGDVCSREASGAMRAGPYLRQWLLWRCAVIRDFVAEAQGLASSHHPGKWVGVIVGGWLPRGYEQGVNWARPGYDHRNRWLAADYSQTTLATTGAKLGIGMFFAAVTEDEARKSTRIPEEAGFDPGWLSVEGCSRRARDVLGAEGGEQAFAVLHLGHYAGNWRQAERAVRAVRGFAGLLIFDATQLNAERWWSRLRP